MNFRHLVHGTISLAVTIAATDTNVLIVGDWGGMDFPPYYTPGQKATAAGMDKIGSILSATAVLALGDNFYFDGIYTDENAHRFEDTWNSVYSGDSLQVPWYLIGGNHDHYGNITAEVAYSTHSERWNFPSLYHTHSFSGDGTSLDVVFIDTVDLAGNSDVHDDSDPRYYDPLPFKPKSDAAEQWEWIEEQLRTSTADYLVVAGHYPVYSVCEHGNTDNMLTNLRPLLIEYGAHYLAGHDHCMSSTQDEHGLLYVVSGTGHACCTKSEHLDDVPPEYLQWYVARENRPHGMSGGFTSMSFSATRLALSFYDQDGELLFSTPPVPPRQKR